RAWEHRKRKRKAHPSLWERGVGEVARQVVRGRGLLSVDEMAAAVLLVALFVGRCAEGLFLAVADGGEAVGRNAQADEILLDGGGAAIAESEVVFGGAAFVTMAF